MFSLREDFRVAVRVLAKHPWATLAAVLAFGLGIGFNTAEYSVAEVLMLRPLLIPDQDRVLMMRSREAKEIDAWGCTGVEYTAMLDSGLFESGAASQEWMANLTGGGDPAQVHVYRATGDFFRVMGLAPAAGRTFVSGDDAAGRDRVVVLSYNLWENRFGADRTAIGRSVNLDGAAYSVAGVMPKGFRFPVAAEAWVPLALTPEQRTGASDFNLLVVGRLKPDVSLAQARAAMTSAGDRLAALYPKTLASHRPDLDLLRDLTSGELTSSYTRMTLFAVAFLLLIACANVAGLQFAHATSRTHEVAIRVAMGASPWRLLRQFLVENLVLAVAGAVAGLFLADWCLNLMRAGMPPEVEKYLPGWHRLSISRMALLYTGMMTLLAALASGLLPAWMLSRTDAAPHLKESARSSSGAARHRLRSVMVAVQVGVSLVLLVGAFLMVKGFHSITMPRANLDPGHLLTFRVALPASRYDGPTAIAAAQQRIYDRLAALPGVTFAGLTIALPYSDSGYSEMFSIEGRTPSPGEMRPNANVYPSGGAYWAAMNLPILDGRALAASDGPNSPKAVVINQAFARHYFPNEKPVGRALYIGRDDSPQNRYVIAGIAGDILQYFIDRSPKPLIYTSYLQSPRRIESFALRTPGDPAALIPSVREAVAAVDPDLPLSDVKSESKVISDSLTGLAYVAVMLGVLGVVALFLSVLGIFGLVSHSVEERTREFGVRIALGAAPGDVFWLVLRRAVLLVATGLLAGLPLAYGLAKLMSGLLFGVNPADLAAFAGVPFLLLASAIAACWWPLRRALHTDPISALRHE